MVSQWSRRSLSLLRLAIWGRSLVEAAATRLRAHTVALWHVVPKGRLTHHPMDHLLICCTEVSNATIQANALSGRTRCRWHGGCVRSTATTNVHGRRWSCWDFVWIMARILRQVLPNTHVSLGLLLLRQIVPRYFLLRWHRRATVILHVRLTEPMIAVWIVAPVVHAATRMLTSPAVWRRRHRWQSTHRAAQTATAKSKLLVSVRRGMRCTGKTCCDMRPWLEHIPLRSCIVWSKGIPYCGGGGICPQPAGKLTIRSGLNFGESGSQ